MSILYTRKGFVGFVISASLIWAILMTGPATRSGTLSQAEAISFFISQFAFAMVICVPVYAFNYVTRSALYRTPKEDPPKKLPTTRNRTVLEAERHHLTEVHLDAIENLHELTRINLGFNHLKTIDLTPLAGSTSLKELVLYMNKIEGIDLSPLATCPNLEYIDLTDNRLGSLDLTPFHTASNWKP